MPLVGRLAVPLDRLRRVLADAPAVFVARAQLILGLGVAPLGTLEKVSTGIELTEKGKWKWERIQRRVNNICCYANTLEQPVFIDAEESWIQNAIDEMASEMMERYNRAKLQDVPYH